MESSILSEVDDTSILRTRSPRRYGRPLNWLPASRLLPRAAGWSAATLCLGATPPPDVSRRMTPFHVRRDKAALFQWVQGPPGDSLQPEATGAGMEVTKCLKPSDSGHQGDCASVQAATRVNAEQASKRSMCRPTR